jgi:hypothetical protein
VAAGFGFLFQNQVIAFASGHRKACYGIIATTIESAVRKSGEQPKATPTTATVAVIATEEPQIVNDIIHAHTFSNDDIEVQFQQLVRRKYKTVTNFFDEMKSKKTSEISRSGMKVALQKLGLELTDGEQVAINAA